MKNICVLLNGAVKNDGRVIKTIRTLSQKFLIDLYYVNGTSEDESIFKENVHLYSVNKKDTALTKILRCSFFYLEFVFLYKEAIKQQKKYEFIIANDLPTLYPAVKLKKKTGGKLIYDSHEIYLETLNQFFPSKCNPIKQLIFGWSIGSMRFMGYRIEKKLLKHVDEFITVNNSLADYFSKKYKFPNIHIMMNCPVKMNNPYKPLVDFKKLYIWDHSDIVFLYQGVLNKGRGLELLIAAFNNIPNNIKLVIIGDGFLKQDLVDWVLNYNLTGQIKFFDTVPNDKLLNYTVAADFGINLLEDYNLSKKYASPNKLFEYMHAGIPVLCSKTLENFIVFEKYEIGILTRNTPEDIVENMMKLANSDRIEYYRQNCYQGSHEYNWQVQSKILYHIFNR